MFTSEREIAIADFLDSYLSLSPNSMWILPKGLILMQEIVTDNTKGQAPTFVEQLIGLATMLGGNWLACSGLIAP